MTFREQLQELIEMAGKIDASFQGEEALGLKSAILAPMRSLILMKMGNWSAEQRADGVAFIRATNLNTQCPITLDELTDANIHEFIMLPSGFVFKKEELQNWIHEKKSFHNPATNQEFSELDRKYLIREGFTTQRPGSGANEQLIRGEIPGNYFRAMPWPYEEHTRRQFGDAPAQQSLNDVFSHGTQTGQTDTGAMLTFTAPQSQQSRWTTGSSIGFSFSFSQYIQEIRNTSSAPRPVGPDL